MPKQNDQKNLEQRVLSGGLVLKEDLPHYTPSKVYKQLVRAQFKLDQIGEEKSRRDAQEILNNLRKQPNNLREFVEKNWHYIQIEFSQSELDCWESSCKECLLQPCSTFGVYKFKADKKFMEQQLLMEGSQIMFRPNGMEGNNPKTHLYAKINMAFYEKRRIYVEMSDLERQPFSDKTYEGVLLANSLPYRSRYRTLSWIQVSHSWEEFIFPSREHSAGLIPSDEYDCLERQFVAQMAGSRWNEQQKQALHAIVSGLHGQVPYILFGPPGTGKTVTLVEAIRRITTEPRSERNEDGGQSQSGSPRNSRGGDNCCQVLVCTPSNTAADAITLELLATGAFGPGTLLRIFSISKKVHKQNAEVLKVSYICEENGKTIFGIPAKDELVKYKVLLCTLSTSTYLVSGDMIDQFSHIFIDEAGQADELETLIPIVGLISPPPDQHSISPLQSRKAKKGRQQTAYYAGTRVILAGDPQQLGPVQTCDPLKRWTKNGSLIERLINRDPNVRIFDFDKKTTTMLHENYRSHPSLISIPSQLFYKGLVRASAALEEKSTLCEWSALPKKGFPLLWHSVEGMEECEENGHSFRNVEEGQIVCDYVRSLVREANVKPGEIGIISPYKYQIRRLREKLVRYPEMQIDSVERFQGSERRVIIISTVRATGIGFLNDDKRFNTAITRPKELLVVIGSRNNLYKVNGWRCLIDFCAANNAILGDTGNSIPPIVQKRRQAVPAIAEQLAADMDNLLVLSADDGGEDRNSTVGSKSTYGGGWSSSTATESISRGSRSREDSSGNGNGLGLPLHTVPTLKILEGAPLPINPQPKKRLDIISPDWAHCNQRRKGMHEQQTPFLGNNKNSMRLRKEKRPQQIASGQQQKHQHQQQQWAYGEWSRGKHSAIILNNIQRPVEESSSLLYRTDFEESQIRHNTETSISGTAACQSNSRISVSLSSHSWSSAQGRRENHSKAETDEEVEDEDVFESTSSHSFVPESADEVEEDDIFAANGQKCHPAGAAAVETGEIVTDGWRKSSISLSTFPDTLSPVNNGTGLSETGDPDEGDFHDVDSKDRVVMQEIEKLRNILDQVHFPSQ